MTNLMKAHRELIRRVPDEQFGSFDQLLAHCKEQRARSTEVWMSGNDIGFEPDLALAINGQQHSLTEWSLSQLCQLHRVDKRTVNRVTRPTACQVLCDTRPALRKPLQMLTTDDRVRAIHGTHYSRLYNDELLEVVLDAACEFTPPLPGASGATGLYAGEQDLFAFAIDPQGWVTIGDEDFAPGFFVWNSEVGRRSIGIQTFWYQRVCANHIVWDAIELFEVTRKHLGDVRQALDSIGAAIESLRKKRDDRRDGFAKAMQQAMHTTLGSDAKEVIKELRRIGISQRAATAAVQQVPPWSSYSAFALLDGLTRMHGKMENAGDRVASDRKAAMLLSHAA